MKKILTSLLVLPLIWATAVLAEAESATSDSFKLDTKNIGAAEFTLQTSDIIAASTAWVFGDERTASVDASSTSSAAGCNVRTLSEEAGDSYTAWDYSAISSATLPRGETYELVHKIKGKLTGEEETLDTLTAASVKLLPEPGIIALLLAALGLLGLKGRGKALSCLAVLFLLSYAEAATVSGVTCKQRWPWNGKVDIDYTLASSKSDAVFAVTFSAKNAATEEALTMTSLIGHGASGVVFGAGNKRATWDCGTDYPNEELNLKVTVTAEDVTDSATYLKVYLKDAAPYKAGHIAYQADAPAIYAAADKTDYLWLRRVEPGTFAMGSTVAETQRYAAREEQHDVTLTKAFYIGVFEVTRDQVDALGMTHTKFSHPEGTYPAYPANNISYDEFRGTSLGATWPSKTDYRVDSTSFMGLLRSKTGNGVIFDLPTDAQWEFACRGSLGTDGLWNDGSAVLNTDEDANLAKIGWYKYNSGDGGGSSNPCCHEVGSVTRTDEGSVANSLGLYDMHGNCWEWCLDWYVADVTSMTNDPVGPETGTQRVIRGGSWNNSAGSCRSAMRGSGNSDSRVNDFGARVCVLFK